MTLLGETDNSLLACSTALSPKLDFARYADKASKKPKGLEHAAMAALSSTGRSKGTAL